MPASKPEEPPTKRKPHWGIYTLCFLALAFVMVVISSTQGHYTIATLAGLIVGFAGAGWCTYRGLQVARQFRLPGR